METAKKKRQTSEENTDDRKGKRIASKRLREASKCEATLNAEFQREDVKEGVKAAWSGSKDDVDGNAGVTVIKQPFTCCVLENFIQESDFLEGLIEELQRLTMFEKNNDLYSFHQSDDLGKIDTPHVVALKKLVYDHFREWLQEVTQISLESKVDMACSLYNDADVLLCHDDELEGRRIAFILYLTTSSWSTEDGGTLDLFSTDENGQPKEIIKSLLPSWNKFVFFEVTPISFHQVSEVLQDETSRLSISGWFHGESVPRPLPWIEPRPEMKTPKVMDEEEFHSWINPEYLKPDFQRAIREKFEADSEISLQDFLQPEKLHVVSEALQSSGLSWTYIGPANRRRYEVISRDVPNVLESCTSVLCCEPMFNLLSRLTGLTLHPDAKSDSEAEEGTSDSTVVNSVGKCWWEWQKWQHGSYTLIHDHEQGSLDESELECNLFFNCEDWDIDLGGNVSYVARGENEELLTVSPIHNALALVYRDKDTLRFVKHINHRVTEMDGSPEFHNLYCVYQESITDND